MIEIILAFSAIVEMLTGLLLLSYPEFVIKLLFGGHIVGTGIFISRIAGAGLFSLGIACWPYAIIKKSFQGLPGLFIYNLIVALYLCYLGITTEMIGILLWPAVFLHFAVSLLLTLGLFKR